MFRALLFSSVGHVAVFAAFAFELEIPMFAIQETDPIEVEIVFEEEQIAVAEDLLIEDFSDPAEAIPPEETIPDDELPVLEAPTPEDFDPLFLPEATDDDPLPDGLEAFAETAENNSNLNADLSRDLEVASTDARLPANDQSPRPEDIIDEKGDELEDLIAALERKAGEGVAQEAASLPEEPAPTPEAPVEPPKNMPLIPKPRPRQAPSYRDLVAERAEADAKLAAAKAQEAADLKATEEAANAASTAKASDDAAAQASANREAAARKSAAEQRSSEYVQTCVDGEWIYPAFIRYPKQWQAGFTLELRADGTIADVQRGKVGVENGASDDKISAFVESAQNALYGCEPFLNPSGGAGESFKLEVVMQPKSAF